MQLRDQSAPYIQLDNPPPFHFSLVFARAADVLEEVQLLWSLATQNNSNNSSHIDRETATAVRKELIGKYEAGWNALFCPGWLEDSETLILESPVSRITPLCEQPGRVGLTEKRVIFQPHGRRISEYQIVVKNIADVNHIADRRYALQNTAMELFFKSCDYKESLFLNFKTQGDRDTFKECMCKQDVAREMLKRKKHSLENWTRDWQIGKISNFQYLMHLNLEAGRSFQDLTQYPVFPWLIQDYISTTLDLDDPTVFRDLSKPIGALNAERLKLFRERYTELSRLSMYLGDGDNDGGIPPPFMYGCHFSSPGYVVFYLMRSSPQLMLKLQNGKFDAADRLFWSLEDAWRSVSTSSTDVKELIPEFYHGNGDFLKNTTSLPNFGCRANGTPVSDVDLPPWATDATDFVTKLSAALESKYVSSRLHQWIDLVFGVNSRGEKAVQADNVFHFLTYDEIALEQLNKAKDPMLKEALRVQMMEFGRTPKQLFLKKHPKKKGGGGGGKWGLISCVPSCVAPPPPRFSTSATIGAVAVAVAVKDGRMMLSPSYKKDNGSRLSAVGKVVLKLTSTKKAQQREASLAWLEKAAETCEPNELNLNWSTAGLLQLIAETERNKGSIEAVEVYCQAIKALCVSKDNCHLVVSLPGSLSLVFHSISGFGSDGRSKMLAKIGIETLVLLMSQQCINIPQLANLVMEQMLCIAAYLSSENGALSAAAANYFSLVVNLPGLNEAECELRLLQLEVPYKLYSNLKQYTEEDSDGSRIDLAKPCTKSLALMLLQEGIKEHLLTAKLKEDDDAFVDTIWLVYEKHIKENHVDALFLADVLCCLGAALTLPTNKAKYGATFFPRLLKTLVHQQDNDDHSAALYTHYYMRAAAACLATLCTDPTIIKQQQQQLHLFSQAVKQCNGDVGVLRHIAECLWHIINEATNGGYLDTLAGQGVCDALPVLITLGERQGLPVVKELAEQALQICWKSSAEVKDRIIKVALDEGISLPSVEEEPLDKEEEVVVEEVDEERSTIPSGSFYSVEEEVCVNGLTPSPHKWNGSLSVTPRTAASGEGKGESNVRLSSHPIEEDSEEEER